MNEKKKAKSVFRRLLEWFIKGNEKAAKDGSFCPS
jgi:hypothetical protein